MAVPTRTGTANYLECMDLSQQQFHTTNIILFIIYFELMKQVSGVKADDVSFVMKL